MEKANRGWKYNFSWP